MIYTSTDLYRLYNTSILNFVEVEIVGSLVRRSSQLLNRFAKEIEGTRSAAACRGSYG